MDFSSNNIFASSKYLSCSQDSEKIYTVYAKHQVFGMLIFFPIWCQPLMPLMENCVWWGVGVPLPSYDFLWMCHWKRDLKCISTCSRSQLALNFYF